MIYAGIGSRQTPNDICMEMRDIGAMLGKIGHTLRSGRALRADSAFEYGCELVIGKKEIFLAGDARERISWHRHAAMFHPLWRSMSAYEKCLHARNSAIMLGSDLAVAVDCVICWTPAGRVTGGTGQALRIAAALNIPVMNLFHPHNMFDVVKFVGSCAK